MPWLPSVLVLAAVAFLVALTIVYFVRKRKKGGCASCAGCTHSAECPECTSAPTPKA